jgi:hypothetical protein
MKNKLTRMAFIKNLNRKGVPNGFYRRDGGKVPNNTKYFGMWLYHNDPIEFEKLWKDWISRNNKVVKRRTFSNQDEEDRRIFWGSAFDF